MAGSGVGLGLQVTGQVLVTAVEVCEARHRLHSGDSQIRDQGCGDEVLSYRGTEPSARLGAPDCRANKWKGMRPSGGGCREKGSNLDQTRR